MTLCCKTYCLFILSAFPLFSGAQHAFFANHHVSFTYNNPAFTAITPRYPAGLDVTASGCVIKKQQDRVSTLANYQRFFDELNIGVGGVAVYDKVAGNTHLDVSAIISYHTFLLDDYNLGAGIRIGYVSGVTDIYNPLRAFNPGVGGTQVSPVLIDYSYADVQAGLLYYDTKNYLGFSVSHINRPVLRIFAKQYVTPLFSLQARRVIPITKNSGLSTSILAEAQKGYMYHPITGENVVPGFYHMLWTTNFYSHGGLIYGAGLRFIKGGYTGLPLKFGYIFFRKMMFSYGWEPSRNTAGERAFISYSHELAIKYKID